MALDSRECHNSSDNTTNNKGEIMKYSYDQYDIHEIKLLYITF